jgi:3',5'-cyclic AMP phosphodiesterase CpdA
MLRSPFHLVVVLICASLGVVVYSSIGRPTYAASANLVWKPYLQQLTDTGVVIRWTTKTGSSSVVRYSTDTNSPSSASASTRTIAALGTQMHSVTLGGLQPDTTYSYKVYTNNEELWPEQTLSFRTAPRRGSSAPFTFAAFGDFGKQTESQQRLRDQMVRDSFRFLVTTGDNAYDAGRYTEFDTKVFQIYGSLFSKVAVFPTLGNHDYATSNGAPYLDLFSLPRNAWRASDQERYYSFDYGNVHVVALDTNTPLNTTDSAAGDDMFDWLRDDLSRTTQPWTIAVVHHAPYSTGAHGSDSRVRSKLVPIFEQYGVDLVLSGHDHIYQRTKPLRAGQVTPVGQGGIVYVVTGAGSAANYGCGSADWLVVAYCAKSYGIYNRIHVNGSQITVEAIDDTGTVRDRFTLSHSSNSTSVAIPGRLEVEDYRSGGTGVGYADSSSGNSGGAYRADDVDIQPCSDGPSCYNVGWITVGEWLAYDLNVTTGGSYTFSVRVATPYTGKSLHLEVDGVNVSGPIALPNTGDWQTWRTVTSRPISLTSGRHTLRLVADAGSFNLNSITVTEANSIATNSSADE